MKSSSNTCVTGILRIFMGWIFLWPFLDKTFGLGFTTAPERSWLAGGSPTAGFLTHGTKGPFAEIFQSMAGNPFVDWLFMIGLLCIGLALIFGVGIRIATYSGTTLLLLMYLAALLPEHNPILDDHIIYSVVLIMLSLTPSGEQYGLGKWWAKQGIVKKFPILK